MTPIISPFIFYLINLFSEIKGWTFFMIVVLTVWAIFQVMLAYEFDEDFKKPIKTKMIVVIVLIMVQVVTPTKETMYQMLVANYVTYENIDIATETIKNSVDYIFEKFGELNTKTEEGE